MINMGGPLLNIVQHGLEGGEVLHIHNKKDVETGGWYFTLCKQESKIAYKMHLQRPD